MAITEFKQAFLEGVNLDGDELRVKQMQSVFMKNMTANLNVNPNADSQAGSNYGVYTPLESNAALNINLPVGSNFCVGFYNSEQTNEGYAFVYNSANNHSIYVVRGDTGAVDLVFRGPELPLVLQPEYFISEGRCTLFIKSYVSPVTGTEKEYKFLIITNDSVHQYFISVEDSIATNSFTGAYFAGAGTFYDRHELIHLGVPTPIDCIKVTPVSNTTPEVQNLMVRYAWQFRVKTYDVFGRPSLHGIVSTPYVTLVGGGCLNASNGLPRCVDLEFDAGNPLVDRIDIEFRKWTDATLGEDLMAGWYKYDTIYRWDNSTGAEWYNRPVNPNINYNAGNNKITYRFCGDKNCEPVSKDETILLEPGLPRTSFCVVAVNKSVALANNVRGFQPVKPSEIGKVKFGFEAPAAGSQGCPPPPMRKVTFYIEIVNPFRTNIQIIRQIGPAGGQVGFGVADCSGDDPSAYNQIFGDQQNPGFIAYMAGMNGTGYAAVSTQVDYDLSTGTDVFVGYTSVSISNYPLQKIEMYVPAGKYVVRLASHRAKLTDADFQKTSTNVLGIVNMSSMTSYYDYYGKPEHELVIDCTAGDVNYHTANDPMFVVMDMSFMPAGGLFPCLFPNRTAAIAGYLVEDQAAGVNTPLEFHPVLFHGESASFGSTTESYGSFYTDHNGYFFAATKGKYIHVYLKTDVCGQAPQDIHIWNSDPGLKYTDGSGAGDFPDVVGDKRNKISFYNGTNAYPDTGRRYVKGKLVLCSDAGVGVPGIPAIWTKGFTAISDASGNFTIIAHNRYTYSTWYAGAPYPLPSGGTSVPDYGVAPGNEDRVIYSQKGGCGITDCGGCNYSVTDENIAYMQCGPNRTTTIANKSVKVAAVGIYGIQSGGKYSVGFACYDLIRRRTYVQVAEGDDQFVYAPMLNDVGYQQFALGRINFNIAAGTNFGSEFQFMTFFVSSNINFRKYLSWSADWIQFTDATGATNPTAPTQIRIYINSLVEYNKQNNFSTNTDWEFLANTENGKPIVGDVIQFIMNGDGTWFPPGLTAQVTYSQDGAFITVDYSVDLAGLMNGALFRVIRPKACQTDYIYYEQCLTIKLVNGVPQTLSGVLPYYDSFMLSRQIPVPQLMGAGGTPMPAIPPGGTPTGVIQYTSTNNNSTIVDYAAPNSNYNNVVKMSLLDAQTSFPFYFEHHAPSDLWGRELAARGRINVRNPNEGEQRIGTEISLSGVLAERGVLNFLGHFVNERSQVFDRNAWGNFMSMLVEVSRMLVITERDHFLTEFGTTATRVTDDGKVVVSNPYGIFDAPQRMIGTNYGCAPADINTIRKYAGKVVWLDCSGFLIFHDFGKAEPFIGNDAYLNNKISRINLLNQNTQLNGRTYFVGGIDPKTNEYFLSSFNLKNLSYINSLRAVNLAVNETILYSLDNGIFKGMAGFTPEMYGTMPSYYLSKNMLTFKNGVPYIHHQGVNAANTFLNFYGTQCKKMFAVVVNPAPEKVKRYMYVEVYCKEHKFIASAITTESGQTSIIPAALWDKRENFWCSNYFCATNTVFDPSFNAVITGNPLYEGDNLFGRWLKQFFESEDADDNKYCEISAVASYFIPSEKSSD